MLHTLQVFLGGILAHAPDLTALTNPTVNSFKRINAAALPTGAPLGPPANAITYGGNNRTLSFAFPPVGFSRCGFPTAPQTPIFFRRPSSRPDSTASPTRPNPASVSTSRIAGLSLSPE